MRIAFQTGDQACVLYYLLLFCIYIAAYKGKHTDCATFLHVKPAGSEGSGQNPHALDIMRCGIDFEARNLLLTSVPKSLESEWHGVERHKGGTELGLQSPCAGWFSLFGFYVWSDVRGSSQCVRVKVLGFRVSMCSFQSQLWICGLTCWWILAVSCVLSPPHHLLKELLVLNCLQG